MTHYDCINWLSDAGSYEQGVLIDGDTTTEEIITRQSRGLAPRIRAAKVPLEHVYDFPYPPGEIWDPVRQPRPLFH